MLRELSTGGTAAELRRIRCRLQMVTRSTRYLTERERIDLDHMGERLGIVARKLDSRQKKAGSDE